MNSQKKRYIGLSLEGPGVQELLSRGVGVCRPPGTWMCSPTWKFPEPPTIGIFVEASSHGLDCLLIPFLAPLPFQGDEGRGGKL